MINLRLCKKQNKVALKLEALLLSKGIPYSSLHITPDGVIVFTSPSSIAGEICVRYRKLYFTETLEKNTYTTLIYRKNK